MNKRSFQYRGDIAGFLLSQDLDFFSFGDNTAGYFKPAFLMLVVGKS
jgi:hypothetical protein